MGFTAQIIQSNKDGEIRVRINGGDKTNEEDADEKILATLEDDRFSSGTLMSLLGLNNPIGETMKSSLEDLLTKAFVLGVSQAEQIKRVDSPIYPPP